MKTAPTVGQVVRLNDYGYSRLHLTSAACIRQSQRMVVTEVEDINAGSGWPPIWVIEVDQPDVNRFMLDATMVDPI